MISESFAVPGRVTGIKTNAKWNKDAARWERTTVFQVQVSDTDMKPQAFGEICRQLVDASGEPALFNISATQIPLPGVLNDPRRDAAARGGRVRGDG